jgi:hypothetical protein
VSQRSRGRKANNCGVGIQWAKVDVGGGSKDSKDEGEPSRDRAGGSVHVSPCWKSRPINTGCENGRSVPDLLVLAGGASVAVVKALSPCLHSLPFESLGALEASAAAEHAGGFSPTSSGRYAVHCLADPNYTISTIAKVAIWRRSSSAASSAMFTAVRPFFRSPTAAARKLLGTSTNVFLCHATTIKFRGPHIACPSRRSKPEAHLNAVQRRNRQQGLTSRRCRMLAGKPDSKRPRCKDKVLSSKRYFTVEGSPFALEDRRLLLRHRRQSPVQLDFLRWRFSAIPMASRPSDQVSSSLLLVRRCGKRLTACVRSTPISSST